MVFITPNNNQLDKFYFVFLKDFYISLSINCYILAIPSNTQHDGLSGLAFIYEVEGIDFDFISRKKIYT